MKKRLSIHDIARELQLSASTISFVLNGKTEEMRISQAVKMRVLDYVDNVGYKPSLVAQSLRTGKTNILGMLVEDISDPFFSAIARSAELMAAKKGYKILFSSTENNTEKTRKTLKLMRERNVDGYIIAPPPDIESDLQELLNEKTPLVLFDRYFPGLATHNVEIDNENGAAIATAHLVHNNFQRIAFVTLDSEQTQMAARLKGYNNVVKEYLMPSCILKIPYNLDDKFIVQHIESFLRLHREVDAVLFATNYLTVDGIKAIQQAGLCIPGDIAIVGFDDNKLFSILSPAVTAVAQPVTEIAEQSIAILLNILSGNEAYTSQANVTLPVSLRIRSSSISLLKAGK